MVHNLVSQVVKELRPLPPILRIPGFLDCVYFSEHYGFMKISGEICGLGGLQSIGNVCGLQMKGFSTHTEPYAFTRYFRHVLSFPMI